ncbi:MAG: GAF domain-containing sensor histidine kinase [bacterium]|nr:MAG: GAF domain-containing sensor histidine kinase [bacterium]
MGGTSSENRCAPERSRREIEEILERKNITFDALFRLFERLGTTLDLKKIVRLFLMTLAGQLKLKRVVLYLRIPERGCFDVYHMLGFGKETQLEPLDADSVFARWLVKTDNPLHIDDFYTTNTEPLCSEERFLKCIVDEGFAMALPLKDQNELVGVIFFSGKVTEERFTDFDMELLQMLARVASITIRNAWLYQAAVRSKMELEKFSKAKKEFINHTSHELRTPLTVLKSALWSIDTDEPDGGILVDMAKDSILRLESRIERLLSLNDIELNETAFDFRRYCISSLIEECLREVIPELEEKQITVDVDDGAKYREINVDAAKIKIVLRSIVENAINFVQQGGKISITTYISNEEPGTEEGTEIGARSTQDNGSEVVQWGSESCVGTRNGSALNQGSIGTIGSYLVVRITDDGIGIPADEIRFLCEPFVKASNSTLANVKGLGIGLSVSQRIVFGHGGRLFCRSDMNRGATFSIWLPLNE